MVEQCVGGKLPFFCSFRFLEALYPVDSASLIPCGEYASPCLRTSFAEDGFLHFLSFLGRWDDSSSFDVVVGESASANPACTYVRLRAKFVIRVISGGCMYSSSSRRMCDLCNYSSIVSFVNRSS